MKENDSCKETFENRASLQSVNSEECEKCSEHLVFALEDSTGHNFSMGLSTIIECLMAAIREGDLPKLPLSWIIDADYVCNTSYSADKTVFYMDSKYPKVMI